MHNITTTAELKNAIQLLEVEQVVYGQLLKEQFHLTLDSLKPINLLKSTLKEMSSSPNLVDNILGTVVGLASGFISKKLVVGASGGIVRKLLGSVMQFGVTNIVAQNSGTFRSVGQFILDHILHKKRIDDRG